MENTENTFAKGTSAGPSVIGNAVRYGLYTSAAFILFSLLMWSLDLSFNWWNSLLQYLIIIIGIVLAILNYRDKLNGGFITFGNAFLTGFMLLVVVVIISLIYNWIFVTYIDPNFFQRALEITEQKLIERGFPDEVIDQQMEASRKMMTGSLKYLGYLIGFFSMLAIGSLLTLIIALILKKKDDSFNSAFNETR